MFATIGKARDKTSRGYHRTSANGWGKVESFAGNRKEKHLSKLEKLVAKQENQQRKIAKHLEQQRVEHERSKTTRSTSTPSKDSRKPQKAAATA